MPRASLHGVRGSSVDVTTATVHREPPPVLLVGTIVWISSELLFFGSLFGAYFTLRSDSVGPWPPPGAELDTNLAALGTAILVTSSATVHLAERAAAVGNLRDVRRWLLATMLLGAGFLALLIREWTALPISVSDNSFSTIYYTLTGFHGFHVFGGLLAMGVLTWRTSYRGIKHGAVEVISYYWHFVDVVWLALFATVYLAG
jgi:cytochrome c oxidase subunit 3